LIQGASGGVGTFAVQLAKTFGAEVTAVCSTRNLEMVHSLGADHVIDYKKEDFIKRGQQYDLILAVNGYHPVSDYLRALRPEGNLVVAGGSMAQLIEVASNRKRVARAGFQKICVLTLDHNQKDLAFIKELIELGKIMPVIDDFYPLGETAEAFWYFEKEHSKGKVVISVV
jgi:NADPH:quinone reductase-like Zn-dependent oxidoreductase